MNLPAPSAPASQALPIQEPGIRPAHVLPYELHANGKFWIDFDVTRKAGAPFNVHAGNRIDGAWRYTLEAGNVILDLGNLETVACVLLVEDVVYRSRSPHEYIIAPGSTKRHFHNLRRSGNRYDLTAIANVSGSLLWQFVGHVETHRASISDLPIGAQASAVREQTEEEYDKNHSFQQTLGGI